MKENSNDIIPKIDSPVLKVIISNGFAPSEPAKQSYIPPSFIEDLQTKASRSLKRFRKLPIEKYSHNADDFAIKFKNFLSTTPLRQPSLTERNTKIAKKYKPLKETIPERTESATPFSNMIRAEKLITKNTVEIDYLKSNKVHINLNKGENDDHLFYQNLKNSIHKKIRWKTPTLQKNDNYEFRIEGKSKILNRNTNKN
ncbi:unnamed protein product [Blepharisma stoltei]|uniref:Uncharacterized protein n=1 Tax=Blepharisma stoltei TaxID=1481888 RepID=A0AAU9IQU7_9CILI|nr:unnamed protein product [Blepharisma stoltei]